MLPVDVRIIGNLSPTDWWNTLITAGAAVTGSVIGGGIAYFVAQQTAYDTRKMQQAERREREEAATLRAITKVMALTNAAAGYHFSIERQIEIWAKNNGGKEPPVWLVMLPQIGKPPEINIDADDLIAFTRARNFDYVTEVLGLFSQYNSMIYGVEGYSIRREALMEQIPPDEVIGLAEAMTGLVGRVAIPDDEFKRLAPKIASVSMLADHLRQEVKTIYEQSLNVVDKFGPIVRAYFKDPKFPIPGVIKSTPKAESEPKNT